MGAPPASIIWRPLADLLLGVSRLADDLLEVTDLELSPVITGPDGVVVVKARVKVTPYEPKDPFLSKLRLRVQPVNPVSVMVTVRSRRT